MKFYAWILFCNAWLLAWSCIDTNAQDPGKIFLAPGHSVVSEITPHKADSFYVKMKKGQFASIRVSQTNVGLDILVYDPRDSLKQIVDENGLGHDEVVTIDASLTGDYKLKVIWNFNRPFSGKYQITLDKIELTATSPALRARQWMDRWYRDNAPGGAVAVVKDNKVIFKYARGLANMDENIPLSASSVFELASVSKQFTGLAIALLIDRKVISLDDDIRKYIPEMPEYDSKITIGNLVYHTSGIRNWPECFELAGFTPEDISTLPMIIKFATSQKHLKFKPGERFSYSNTNYNLLAEVVARVTGKSFTMWTNENIFKPLQMQATFFKEDPGFIYAQKVLNYKPTKDGFVQRPLNLAAVGSTSVYSNLDDLVKWVVSFETSQLITDRVAKILETRGTLNDGSKIHYAFGNEFGNYHQYTRIQHLGLVLGYRTSVARFPEQNLAVIYLSNDDDDATYQRVRKITDLFLPSIPEEKLSLRNLPKTAEVLAKLEKKPGTANVDLSVYAGIYFSPELNSSLPLIVKHNNTLVIAHPRMREISLSYKKENDFGFIQFTRDSSGKVSSLKVSGENVEFKRID